jgi:alpha-N-arabinofuranosidase
MANLAQTVNVLQSVLLTRGSEMVRTPTFYVFKMFRVHQDATMLPVDVACEDYTLGNRRIPALTVSASRDGRGRIHVSMANLNPNKDLDVACGLRGAEKVSRLTGQVLTAAAMNATNDFGRPEEVKPAPFSGFKFDGQTVAIRLPAKSVVVLEAE